MYRLTEHAKSRAFERLIDDDALAGALAGREVNMGGQLYYYDRHTRTVIVTEDAAIVTVYRLTRKEVKQKLSR